MSNTASIRAKASKPVNERLGRNIRDLMFAKGKTQVEVALAIGVDQTSMSRRVRGRTDWAPDELVVVAAVLGVSIADLFGEYNEAPNSPEGWAPSGSNRRPKD